MTGSGIGSGSGSASARLTAWVEGRVQGVGFRWWVRSRALELGLAGLAENLPDGRVKVIAEGPPVRCEELLGLLQGGDTPGLVRRVTSRWAAAAGGLSGFVERLYGSRLLIRPAGRLVPRSGLSGAPISLNEMPSLTRTRRSPRSRGPAGSAWNGAWRNTADTCS